MRFEPTTDERRLLDALIARPVLVTVVATLAVAVIVSLWQPVAGGVIFAVGVVSAARIAARMYRRGNGQ